MSEPPAATPKWHASYSEEIAAGMIAGNEKLTGLPAFIGIRLVEFDPGRLRAEMQVKPELLTPFGNIHGGVLSAVCDHVLGCVCYPHMQKGQWAATTEFKINLLAPVSQGTVTADAEIASLTRSTAVVRIAIRNEGRDVAIAQGTVMIRDPR